MLNRECPDCGADRIIVLRTRTRNRLGNRILMPNGEPATSRCMKCPTCGYRWSLRTATSCGPPYSRAAYPGRRFTDDEVAEILTSCESNPKLAARFGVTPQAISALRRGENYANVRPDIPRRRAMITCHQCVHWAFDLCEMGFPDPEELGPRFAVECALFTAKE